MLRAQGRRRGEGIAAVNAPLHELPPWTADDFDDVCESCGAFPGEYCRLGCPDGYTAAMAREDAERRARTTP